jgi:putative ABC transport system permease protein
MNQTLYLAWRYLAFHRFKTVILITAITLIFYLPVGLRVLVEQSSQQLTARAVSTPLIVGAKGSPLELALNSLYFRSDVPQPSDHAEAARLEETGLARAIPLYVRFHARGLPIVGTSFEYFAFRGLRLAAGRQIAVLGECVVGKLHVVGVLAYADTADDDAIFVDLKTTWIIQGLGHGHQDLATPEAAGAVLAREGNRVTANASVVQYTEITQDNIDSFHFHGDLSGYPITAVLAVPHDQKSSALLQGRYQSETEVQQILRPETVMNELLGTILTVQRFVVAGAVIVGLATLATAVLVFMLSLRLRRRERITLFKIGGSRLAVASVMASEIVVVVLGGLFLAGGLTLLTRQFGSTIIRALIRM